MDLSRELFQESHDMDYVATTAEPGDGADYGKRRRKTGTRAPRSTRGGGRAKGEKIDQRGRPTTGRIARILYGQGFGFIRVDARRDVFFHRKDVFGGTFNELAVDDRVALELIEDALTGPRAVRVAPRLPKHSSAA
jgi:cold shock CspA family protein